MSAAWKRIAPITNHEFRKLFSKSVPPTGWPAKIGVANSGGPDSTCLLFLIHRYLKHKEVGDRDEALQNVVSFTIDHDLQAASSEMTRHCEEYARSLGVEHVSAKIPWSKYPYPQRPEPGETFYEADARQARYHLLFEGMKSTKTDAIAFGHHLDDQVETSLMRLGRGSTKIGAGGMRPCRRWGMGSGNDDSIAWTGYEGMSKWIVRPLLDITKDRILATCEEHKLEYLTDKTNFQPHLTVRNAIRHLLNPSSNEAEPQSTEPLPPDIAEKMDRIREAVESLPDSSIDLSAGPDQLRGAVQELAAQVQDIDQQVDSRLSRSTLPSPVGTCLLTSRALSQISEGLVRSSMVLRVMRYVSFHPWGSIRADGGRKQESLTRIIDRLWNAGPGKPEIFVAGGGVIWTPVVVRDGNIKFPDKYNTVGMHGDISGWLASRQPPLSIAKMVERGLTNPLRLDVTEDLGEAQYEWENGHRPSPFVDILWDCRFLVRFDVSKLPADIIGTITGTPSGDRIVIHPQTRWYWPKVMTERMGTWTTLHSVISNEDNNSSSKLLPIKVEQECRDYWQPRDQPVAAEWISIEWIRSLDAI